MKLSFGKICLILLIGWGCKGKKKEKESAEAVAMLDPIEAAVKAQCQSWNDANSIKDATLLGELYADTLVNFYGIWKAPRQYCVDDQHKWFADNPDAKQSIKGDSIRLERLPNDTLKAFFTKELVKKGVPTDLPAYLMFLKVGDAYKIVAESDVGLEAKAKKAAPKPVVKPAAKPVGKK